MELYFDLKRKAILWRFFCNIFKAELSKDSLKLVGTFSVWPDRSSFDLSLPTLFYKSSGRAIGGGK